MYDVIVVGTGPAGLSAAVNLRARGRSVLVLGPDIESNPLYRAEKISNYPGFPDTTGPQLLRALRGHAESAGAEFRRGRVLSAMPSADGYYVSLGDEVLESGALILATGVVRSAKYPGEAELLGRGVSYCATCDGMLYRKKEVAVLGFGADSAEEAEFLRSIGCQVHYFDRPRQAEMLGEQRVERIRVDGQELAVDGVFILRQSLAPTDLLPTLEMEQGYIRTDREMQTNLPGVFACGDCTGAPFQIAKAVGEGLVAGQRADRYLNTKGEK